MRSERQKRRNGEREIRRAERLKDSNVFRKKQSLGSLNPRLLEPYLLI